jgi:hypothetical protein
MRRGERKLDGEGARAGRFNAGAAGERAEKNARKRRKQLGRGRLKESGEG